ncbi:MAG: acyl-ACP thioesterase domain-containing protein [Bacteroidota bacterium]
MPQHPHIRYEERYAIRTYEIDSSQRITIPALVTLMQETAMQQVIKLNVSLWDLEALNMSWVMMRMQLKITQLPRLGQTLRITTNPAGFEKFFTYRDYRVYNEQDELIATAASTWLMMDTVKRRMTRIPAFILKYEPPTDLPFLPRPYNKLLPIQTPYQRQTDFKVNWHDLDFNEHLSNVSYIRWMVESMEDDFLRRGQLRQLDLFFRSEALWKDDIVSEIQEQPDRIFRHRLLRKSDQKELAVAQSQWDI